MAKRKAAQAATRRRIAGTRVGASRSRGKAKGVDRKRTGLATGQKGAVRKATGKAASAAARAATRTKAGQAAAKAASARARKAAGTRKGEKGEGAKKRSAAAKTAPLTKTRQAVTRARGTVARKAVVTKAARRQEPVPKASTLKAKAQKAPAQKAPVSKAATQKAPVVKAAPQKAPIPKATARKTTAKAEPPTMGGARKAPALNRARRTVLDDDIVASPPSSLDLDRSASAARSGRQELRERIDQHNETSPELTAGDVDADWEGAYSSGDEAPGGDNPTPDQDIVDEIGKAVGVVYGDSEELKGEAKISERDRHRWELDPESAEDFDER